MAWLIHDDIFREMERAHSAGFIVSAEQQRQHEERNAQTAEGMPRNLKIAGDVAEIRIEGALTNKPDFFAWYFGGGNTTYQQIQQALAIAAVDPSVKRCVLRVDSPGGHVHGLFDTLAALDAFKKPMSVVAAQAQSAAYALAAVSGKIEATNEAAPIGSIGVAARFFVSDSMVDITSTEAPNKRPDVTTDEGKATVRKELDDIHDMFVDAIAHGRKVTAERVNQKFGRGATLLAREAKKLGMVDRIAQAALRPVDTSDGPSEEEDPIDAAASGGAAEKANTMDIELFQKQHPEVYAAVLNAGVTQERKRVSAHLKLAKSTGAVDVAYAAIASGASTMDEDVHADYLSAAMNRRDQATRQSDASAVDAAVGGGVTAGSGAQDIGDRVADIIDMRNGKLPAAAASAIVQ